MYSLSVFEKGLMELSLELHTNTALKALELSLSIVTSIHLLRDRQNHRLFLNQAPHVHGIIDEFNMINCRPVSLPMDPKDAHWIFHLTLMVPDFTRERLEDPCILCLVRVLISPLNLLSTPVLPLPETGLVFFEFSDIFVPMTLFIYFSVTLTLHSLSPHPPI